MQDLNWNSLQFVLALARQGSLERAARGLGVDPSTVSRTIRALEGDVGARIFDRTLAGHRPTEVGRRVVEAAERVEANILAMRRLADRADERLEGVVWVVTSEAVAGRLAGHRLGHLRPPSPDCRGERRRISPGNQGPGRLHPCRPGLHGCAGWPGRPPARDSP